jgi:hypothetical protein
MSGDCPSNLSIIATLFNIQLAPREQGFVQYSISHLITHLPQFPKSFVISHLIPRRGVRVVEGASRQNREKVCTGNCIAGSNGYLILLLLIFWRGVRVVEGARLESVYTGNCIAGSNPALSADNSKKSDSKLISLTLIPRNQIQRIWSKDDSSECTSCFLNKDLLERYPSG